MIFSWRYATGASNSENLSEILDHRWSAVNWIRVTTHYIDFPEFVQKKYRTLTYLVFWKPVIWSPQKDSNTFVCYKMYIGVIQFWRNISLKRLLWFLTLMLRYFCQKGSYRDIVWLIRLKDTKFSSRNKWCVNGTIEQEVVQEHCDQKVTSSSPTADVIISFIYYLYFLSLAAWSIGWEIIKMTRKKRVLLEAAYHHSDGRLKINFVISQIGFLERRVV